MDHAEGAATPGTGQARSTRCPHARASRPPKLSLQRAGSKSKKRKIDESQSQRLTGQNTSAKVSTSVLSSVCG